MTVLVGLLLCNDSGFESGAFMAEITKRSFQLARDGKRTSWGSPSESQIP